ncbi:MAG TPA: tRNA (guanosine(46)-N7)-methyltransferase TrmB [Petrotoga sp.]|nr:tRNA (guanosine(46)-N7)-methyltransferase TrmB [Petrotoga sp.]
MNSYSYLQMYQINTKDLKSYPIEWNKIFGNSNKSIVEIGFGGGEFLVNLAKENNNYNYVGLETSLTSCHKIKKKIFQNNLNNIQIILEDAKFALREFFSDNSISKVIVNFPCPWPKSKHAKNRLFDENFIDTLSSVLEVDGEVILTTDVFWYASDVKEKFLSNGCFKVKNISEVQQLPFKTRYEKKWENEGRKKYLLIAQKRCKKDIKRLLEGEFDLPHEKIKRLDFDKLQSLVGFKKSSENHNITIKDIYAKLDGSEYLVKVFSEDKGYIQSYFVNVIKIKEGWLVKLDDIAKAYRTPSVKEAVNIIAKELEN